MSCFSDAHRSLSPPKLRMSVVAERSRSFGRPESRTASMLIPLDMGSEASRDAREAAVNCGYLNGDGSTYHQYLP